MGSVAQKALNFFMKTSNVVEDFQTIQAPSVKI